MVFMIIEQVFVHDLMILDNILESDIQHIYTREKMGSLCIGLHKEPCQVLFLANWFLKVRKNDEPFLWDRLQIFVLLPRFVTHTFPYIHFQ